MEDSQPAVFKGTYRHRIDPKGRLPVPAAFRRALREEDRGRLVLTLLDQCLGAFPPGEWQRLEEQLRLLPPFSGPVKSLTRLLASRAADCELDQQGRMLLPPLLRQAAGLRQEAVVVGVLSRFEVWSPEAWEGFLRESERLLEDASFEVHWPPPGPTPAAEAPVAGRRPQGKPSR